jgi:hypothetical protein
MSGQGDETAFYSSVTDKREESANVLFRDKNYSYIVDQTSSAGSFASNQCQFDLSTLGSQSQWINLNEGIIEFPVRISATAATAASTVPLNAITLKNGFHHWIDSAQLIIDGQTIQSAQPYQNVHTTFKILSEWSQDTYTKYGRSCGVILDDCTSDTAGNTTAGINNVASADNTYTTTNPINSLTGFNAYASGLNNKALNARTSMLANVSGDTDASGTILQKFVGTPSVKTQGLHNGAAASSGTGTRFAAYFMCTVRLRDICDIDNFPMTKNIRGYLYLNFNATQTVLTAASSGTILGSSTISPLAGRTCPYMVNMGAITFANDSVTTITGVVNGESNITLNQSGPLMTTARLLVPYYDSNPKADGALTQSNHFFTTTEKIVNPITCAAGQSVNVTLTSGVPNPRGLVMLPMWQQAGTSPWISPEATPYTSEPGTSGAFATLARLQVYKANRPLYQNVVDYTFEQWQQENSKTGLGGGLVDEQASGLLTEQLFNQNHRYYYVDLSRRENSGDGASQSIQVAFSNPGRYSMKVICMVLYEKKWVIDTALCKVSSAV